MNNSKGIDYYLKVNKYFLSFVGQWPYQLPRERIFFRLLCHGLCTLILIPGVSILRKYLYSLLYLESVKT